MGVGPWMLPVYATEFDQMASGGSSFVFDFSSQVWRGVTKSSTSGAEG
jgi:hypothetical protein